MNRIENQKLSGERALYDIHDAEVVGCYFFDGESPLKECSNLKVNNCTFDWKYPIWYGHHVDITDSVITSNGRAGIWYMDDCKFINDKIDAPKCFRRCKNLEVTNTEITDAKETFWYCDGVKLKDIKATGDYLCLNSKNVVIDNLYLDGNYGFDTCENIEMRNSTVIGRDVFWNCKNITVYDSKIIGKYLAWNSENVTFVNCHIESLQGLCYIKNVKLVNCTIADTELAFEFAENLDAEVNSTIDSVTNITSGRLICNGIGELNMDEKYVDPSKTIIVIRK